MWDQDDYMWFNHTKLSPLKSQYELKYGRKRQTQLEDSFDKENQRQEDRFESEKKKIFKKKSKNLGS